MASSVVVSRCAATCSASPSPEPSVEPGHAADGHAAEALDQLGVRVGARIGLRRAAVQHDHGDLQSSCPSRLEREQRVVYRAEPRAGDEHERKPEPAGEVGDRPVLAHRHEQPAGAFDDEQVVAARELPDGLEDHVGYDGPALELRGHERRQRRGEGVRAHVVRCVARVGSRPQQHGVPRRIVSQGAALDRLRDADVVAMGGEQPCKTARDRRLADLGVGGGDEVAPHGVPSVASVTACPRIPSIASRSSGSVASGGRNVTTSPSGRVIIPSSRARAQTRAPMASVQS